MESASQSVASRYCTAGSCFAMLDSSSILALAPRKAGCRTVKGPGPSGRSG